MKGIGNLTQIMKQAKDLQARMTKLQEDLANFQAEAAAGGGMVVAVANGRQELVSLKIEREVVKPEDVVMLQDLVLAAVNQALTKSRELAAAEMAKLTGGISLPGMMPPL